MLCIVVSACYELDNWSGAIKNYVGVNKANNQVLHDAVL